MRRGAAVRQYCELTNARVDPFGAAPDPGTVGTSKAKSGTGADGEGSALASVSSAASAFLQEDAVRSLLVIALGLSLCLHFLHWLRGE